MQLILYFHPNLLNKREDNRTKHIGSHEKEVELFKSLLEASQINIIKQKNIYSSYLNLRSEQLCTILNRNQSPTTFRFKVFLLRLKRFVVSSTDNLVGGGGRVATNGQSRHLSLYKKIRKKFLRSNIKLNVTIKVFILLIDS